MTENEHEGYLTVKETAERLGESEATVRRMIREFQLPASRKGRGSRAPWLIHGPTLERRLEAEERKRRLDARGVVVGYGDFAEKLEERHPDLRVGSPDGPTLAEHARATIARHELFERLEREMAADTSLQHELDRLDEEQRFEQEARELARRIRREERLRERALEILEEDDLDQG